jgi:two-component system chemotaxis response regulator CheY
VKSLVVEDEVLSRTLLLEILRPCGTVHAATNGTEAIDAVRAALKTDQPYQLICLDIQMPDLDGIAVLREVRLEEQRARIDARLHAKVLMTTAVSAKTTIVEAIQAGCDGYMLKLYDPDRVRQQLWGFGLIV